MTRIPLPHYGCCWIDCCYVDYRIGVVWTPRCVTFSDIQHSPLIAVVATAQFTRLLIYDGLIVGVLCRVGSLPVWTRCGLTLIGVVCSHIAVVVPRVGQLRCYVVTFIYPTGLRISPRLPSRADTRWCVIPRLLATFVDWWRWCQPPDGYVI